MNADLISVHYGTATYRCPEGHQFCRFIVDPMSEGPAPSLPCIQLHDREDIDACS